MSSFTAHKPTNLLQSVDKRILIAVAGFVVAGIVGATSFAAAAPNKGDKPTKEWCAAQGFSNYGQCVSAWAHGQGYGGTTNNVNASNTTTQNVSSGDAYGGDSGNASATSTSNASVSVTN